MEYPEIALFLQQLKVISNLKDLNSFFTSSLPFNVEKGNVFQFWLQFLERLPLFELEKAEYLNPHVFVADRIRVIEEALP